MEKQNNYSKLITLGLSTALGIGYFPYAPGTFASLFAVGVFVILKNNSVFVILTLATIVASFLVSGKSAKILKTEDPKQVVIDEFAGQFLALLFIPKEAAYIFLGFILFRIFDIIKPFPADYLEKKKGSLGIVGDDLVAGIYANILIQLARLIIKLTA
ncbi:MAG: phosphatidylglycerophosphatase A [Candidatus Omnitrophica bacterium]|nr:phosphatidylglycerophosphatase A [Candidatus Omnitrophota bacterium]